jgi:1,4-dihydroxy-2-naphthoate octaprenyltransferase
MSKEKILAWIRISRLPFHTALSIPFILGTILAWSEGHPLNWTVFLLGLVAVILITNNCFLTNEYFDYEADRINRHYNRFTGGSRVLPEASLPRRQVFKVSLGCMLVALVLGLILHFHLKTGPLTLPLGITGIFFGYFYTAKPIQFSYRGMGEICIGIIIGFLPGFIGYYLQVHRFSWSPIIVCLPWVVAVTLFCINMVPDIESDKIVGKETGASRLGKSQAMVVYNMLVILMWLLFIPLFFLNVPKITLLLLFIPLFLSGWNLVSVWRGDWKTHQGMENLCGRTIASGIATLITLSVIFLLKRTLS